MSPGKPIRLLGAIINAGYKLGYIPYQFDHKNNEAKFNPSLTRKILMGVNLLGLGLYESLLVYRYLQGILLTRGNVGQHQKISGLSISFLYLSANFNQYLTVKQWGLQHIFLNQFLKSTTDMKNVCEYGASLTKEEELEREAYNRRSRNAMIGGVLTWLLASTTRALRVLIKPQSPELFTSLTDDPKALPLCLKCLVALLQWNITGFHSFMVTFHGCVIIAYTFAVIPILKDLTLSNDARSRTRITAETIRCVQPRLSVLQRSFDSMYGIWPFGFEICCGSLVMMRLFLAVTLRSARDLITGTCMLFTIVMIFRGFADIHDISLEALKSWSILVRPEWFCKFRKSCVAICISVGGFFVADNQLVLTIISIIVTNTTSLVLTIRSS